MIAAYFQEHNRKPHITPRLIFCKVLSVSAHVSQKPQTIAFDRLECL
jgi:hypothetical protein